MRLLASNLLLLSILAAICVVWFVASLVRVSFVRPNWLAFRCGVALLALVGIGVAQVVRDPGGQVDVIDEKEVPKPLPDAPKKALERLVLSWDSQDVAKWPASETLAEISEIAYLPPHAAEHSYRGLGFTEVMPIVQGSMIGYIITGGSVTVIAFRGTDVTEISDWVANLDRSPADTTHGEVHRGFYEAYASMKSQVDAILKGRDTTHLWVTGHSLGGALALMCAYDLLEIEQRDLRGVITFGQPMVARQKFAKYIDEVLAGRYARFVNRSDIVPKVPPSHAPCGSLIWFTDQGVKRSKITNARYGDVDHVGVSEDQLPTEAGEEEGIAEVAAMTEADFKRLQSKLKEENMNRERLPDGSPMMMYQGTGVSLFDDHEIGLYVDNVRGLLEKPGLPKSN